MPFFAGIIKGLFISPVVANKNLILLHQDILTVDIEAITKNIGSYKLIANIPYYITGAIIEKFLMFSVSNFIFFPYSDF